MSCSSRKDAGYTTATICFIQDQLFAELVLYYPPEHDTSQVLGENVAPVLQVELIVVGSGRLS